MKRALTGSNLTKAKCCFLLGHMTKSSRTFCQILKSHPDILDELRQCCFEEDSHVRKVKTNDEKTRWSILTIFSDGVFCRWKFHFNKRNSLRICWWINAVSCSSIKRYDLKDPFACRQSVSSLVVFFFLYQILTFWLFLDTLGFLARYRLSERLIELKVPEKLLDVACHDTHVTVQEFAFRVLKQMLKHDEAKEVRHHYRKKHDVYSDWLLTSWETRETRNVEV